MIFDKLSRIQRRRKNYVTATEGKIKQLHKEGKHKEASDLLDEMRYEEHMWHDAIQSMRTETLVTKAERVGVPVPRDEELWFTAEDQSASYLSIKAQHELNKAIRQEQKERRDIVTTLIKDIISPIGAIIISIL